VPVSDADIDAIRLASRALVRELGFMGGRFAGTDLSPSAVHALIEIEQGGVTARDLAARLHLEKSSVSRLLRRLAQAGCLSEEPGATDSRLKILALTRAGQDRVAGIHSFARAQVAGALARLDPGQEQTVEQGLQLYARALAAPPETPPSAEAIRIRRGYQTALIARITQMHAQYYARQSAFGQSFESVVAAGLAEFCNRLDNPRNGIWTASRGESVLGSVAIDGEDLGPGRAHLRWFIMDDTARGSGAGRRLLAAALAHADDIGADETHLWTFAGLAAARHLYEAQGFALAEERPGRQWGTDVLEQRFVRPRP
jgi:DNA-binding MarR family transcriptional regulator/GNAT superfamily N-acetyltransferase